jgi:hypothetical protein
MRATCPANPTLIVVVTFGRVWWSLQIMKFLIMQSSRAS